MKRVTGWICSILAACFVGAAITLSVPSQVTHIQPRWLLELLLFAAGLLLTLAAYIIIHRYNQELDSDGTHLIEDQFHLEGEISLKHIDNCMKEAFKQYSDGEIDQIVIACCDPSLLIKRTVEHIELFPTRVSRRIARELVVPGSDEGRRVVLPILRQSKGMLIDELEVESDGKEGHTLAHSESIGIAALLLRQLYVSAFLPTGNVFDARHQTTFQTILSYALSHSPTPRYLLGRREQFLNQLRMAPEEDKVARDAFLAVFEFLMGKYFVFHEFWLDKNEKPARVGVDVTTSDNRSNLISRPMNRFKLALGIGIHDWLLDLGWMYETPSYHLRCKSPEGTYLYRAGIRATSQTLELSPASLQARIRGPQEVRIARTRGTDTIHMYASGFDSVSSHIRRFMRLNLTFRAVPPGLLGPVTILSLYLALIVGIFYWQHDLLFESKSTTVLALLLAIPGITSGWIAGRLNSKSIWIASYLLLLELFALLALSAASTVIAVLKAAKVPTFTWHLNFWFGSSVSIDHPVWFIVLFLCASHFIFCLGDLASRTYRYQRCLADR